MGGNLCHSVAQLLDGGAYLARAFLVGADFALESAYLGGVVAVISTGLNRVAPAAKYYHQAYEHGLLEHCLGVAQAVSAISATFPGIDRDVAITGALLHDIGKLEAYTEDPQNIDLTDAGRLQGEIPLGYYRIRRAIEDIDGFSPALAQAVLHIILSHHGTLEHGSPVVPCTREATLVHMIDNLGGRLGSFDRIEKELAPGASWSGFDRAINGSAFFADRCAPEEAESAEPKIEREAELQPSQEQPGELAPVAAEVGAQITLTDVPAREAA